MPHLLTLITSLPTLSPRLLQFLESAPLPDLMDATGDKRTVQSLQELLKSEKFSPKIRSSLWLLVGELDRSHELSQEIHDADGSFLHGIMHRREGDFWNAKYWFKKVGKHPIFRDLAKDIGSEKGGTSSLEQLLVHNQVFQCESMVDLCESVFRDRREGNPNADREWEIATQVAWLEWQHLFAWCWQSE